MNHAIEVCLTADIEFEINGALSHPDMHRPSGAESILRLVNGREEGLAPLLAPLKRFGLPATFFVEALQCIYFGTSPMKHVLERIMATPRADVQLHVHPCWLNFRDLDWPARVKRITPNDMMAGREADADEIILCGRDYFVQLAGKAPIALRTGNLSVDLNVYAAQARAGIPLASSVGLAIAPSPDADLRQYGGIFRHHGVVEVPVTSFRELGPKGHCDKLLTVTGNSFWQLRRVLDWAWSTAQGPVVILTHVSEMAEAPGLSSPPVFAPLYRNQRRWFRLCEYLAEFPDRFRVCSFSEAWASWRHTAGRRMLPHEAGIASPLSRLLEQLVPLGIAAPLDCETVNKSR